MDVPDLEEWLLHIYEGVLSLQMLSSLIPMLKQCLQFLVGTIFCVK